MSASLTTSAPEPSTAYHLTCWGDFALRRNGEDVSPRGRKARALIAYLGLHRGRPISREHLARLLWSEQDEEHARASLRQCLHHLQTIAPEHDSLIMTCRDTVEISAGRLSTDLDTLDEAVHENALAALARAIPERSIRLFCTLDSIAPAFDDWLRAERMRQHERLSAIGEGAARAGLARGEVAGVRMLAGRLRSFDAANESVARIGMRADVMAGEHGAARRRYEELRAALRTELDVAPSPDTEALLTDLMVCGVGLRGA